MSGSKRTNMPAIPSSPTVRSTSATYVANRDGDPYSSSLPPSSASTYSDRHAKRDAVGDVYSCSGGNVDKDRSSGSNAEKADSGRFFSNDLSSGNEPALDKENDEDVEGKKQIRTAKQDSLASNRNFLRLPRETGDTARTIVTGLGTQSEGLADIECHPDVSEGYSQRAEDKTDKLEQLNLSIFRRVTKDAKRAAQEAKVQQRYESEGEQHEKTMMDIRGSKDRLDRVATYADSASSRSNKAAAQLNAQTDQRRRYQFEASASDEDQSDDNLDEISDVTKRLKALGTTTGLEPDKQNQQILIYTMKTDQLDNAPFHNTQKLNRIK